MGVETVATAAARVLSYLRSIPEKQLHIDVIWPLLREIGADHLQYTHGAFERGKDFLFVMRDVYGDDQLEVCQVKNDEFSGQASKSGNTIAVLNQVLQCRSIEVFNPAQSRMELPTGVTLITAYDVPDKDVAGAQSLLSKLKEQNCKIIGPTKLLRLIETHLPRYYAEVATPGGGVGRALLSHLMFHQEASAFQISRKRPLTDFFINLGFGAIGSALEKLGRASFSIDFDTNEHVPVANIQRFKRLQEALPSPLNNIPIFIHDRPTSGELGTQVPLIRVELSPFLVALASELTKLTTTGAPTSGKQLGNAIRLLSESNELLITAFRLIERYVNVPPASGSTKKLPSISLAEVAPLSVLGFEANLCFVGMGGSGKTTLARMIAQIALDQGKKCVYFPCTQIRKRESELLEEMVAFIKSLDADLNLSTIRTYCKEAELIILDGVDEATTYGTTLGEEIRRLTFQGKVTLQYPAAGAFNIPRDLDHSVSYDSQEQQLVLHRPLSALGFDRLRHVNEGKHTVIVDKLENAYRKSAPRVLVTTREIGLLNLPADFQRVTLLPFSDDQIKTFYLRWFSDRPADATSVLNFLKENPDVREICRTPMIATIVAALHENRSRPPRSRTQVYQRRFELLLERWDQSRGVLSRNQIDMDDKLVLLGRLALACHRDHRRTFNRSELDEVWNNSLARRYESITVDDLISELRFSNTVIYPAGNGEFSLGHLTYQEYLCARAIVFGQLQSELLGYFADPWWSQVLVFFAGLAGDIESFMKTVHARLPLSGHQKDLLNQMTREAAYTGTAAHDAVADMSADGYGNLEGEEDSDNDMDDDYREE